MTVERLKKASISDLHALKALKEKQINDIKKDVNAPVFIFGTIKYIKKEIETINSIINLKK